MCILEGILMKTQTGKHWIIPYVDQPLSFWAGLFDRFGDVIKSVYLPLPGLNVGSGRPPQPTQHTTDFLNSREYPTSILINPIILQEPLEVAGPKILEQLEKALSRWLINDFTVVNLSLAAALKARFPEVPVTASTLMEIYAPNQLTYIEDIDVVVPSTRITRNMEALTDLKRLFKGKIRLMVNEGCLPGCPFRVQHFYEMAFVDSCMPRSLCENVLRKKPWLRLTGGWILPQHLHLYDGLYDELKLTGRISLSKPRRYHLILEHYTQCKPLPPHQIGAGPAAVNLPIEISEAFFRYTLNCNKECDVCQICRNYWTSCQLSPALGR
jgi:hypothetical protein